MEFAKYVNEYLHGYIRFADAKAGVVFLIAGAMLGYLIQEGSVPQFREFPSGETILFLFASLPDVLAMALGLRIVYPRLTTDNTRRGVIFWEDIRKFTDGQEYATEMAKLTDDTQRAEALALENYLLAKIAHGKYDQLQLALACTGVGAFFTLVLVIFY